MTPGHNKLTEDKKDNKEEVKATDVTRWSLHSGSKSLPDFRSDEKKWDALNAMLRPLDSGKGEDAKYIDSLGPQVSAIVNDLLEGVTCPISKQILRHPVVTQPPLPEPSTVPKDPIPRILYERESMLDWFGSEKSSRLQDIGQRRYHDPITKELLPSLQLVNVKIDAIQVVLKYAPKLEQYIPRQWQKDFNTACSAGDIKAIRTALKDKDPLLLTRPNKRGNYPLHSAVLNYDGLGEILSLLEQRREGLAWACFLQRNLENQAPLEFGLRAYKGDPKERMALAAIILRCAGSGEALAALAPAKEPPLPLAAQRFLEGILIVCAHNYRATHNAVHLDKLRVLLSWGVNPSQALHRALEEKNIPLKAIKILVNGGADLQAGSVAQNAPIFKAIRMQRVDVMLLLCQRNVITSENAKAVLELACKTDNRPGGRYGRLSLALFDTYEIAASHISTSPSFAFSPPVGWVGPPPIPSPQPMPPSSASGSPTNSPGEAHPTPTVHRPPSPSR